jgi:excinuclease ABC subunit B
MPKFEIVSNKTPQGDQVNSIKELVNNINQRKANQVLLGATGTGKTFTIANVIERTQKKTLIMVNNKTLASQLYSEFKELFPNNHVEYFVSYFDFFQPEAYLPRSDTYIEKSAKTNQEIEMLRLSTINSLASADDVIVVASVAAIYASVSPSDFNEFRLIIKTNEPINLKQFVYDLVRLQYERNEIDLPPGSFRVKGDIIEVAPGHTDLFTIRISLFDNQIEEIAIVDALTHKVQKK